VSPTRGEQENSVWNCHYACTCYHPLFVFNQFGDLERCDLRPGNVHSADGWDDMLKPVVACCQGKVSRIYFRADAGFANPDVYEFLEGEFVANAVRLQLHALAYNLGNFLRVLATPEPIKDWSLTSLKEKLIKIGAKVVNYGGYVAFQMAEVAIPRQMAATTSASVRRSIVMRSQAIDGRSVPKCQGKWPDQPPTTVRAARCAGGRPHLASVLQEGDKSANIHVRSGAIWGIPACRRCHPQKIGRKNILASVGVDFQRAG